MPPNPYDTAWLAQYAARPDAGVVVDGRVVHTVAEALQDGGQEARNRGHVARGAHKDLSPDRGGAALNLEPPRRQKRVSLPKWQMEEVQGFPDHVTLILSPLKTVNESNEPHGGWRTKMARTKKQRQVTYWWLHHWLPTLPAVWAACTVTLTRIAPGILDDDGLQSAMKHVRDGVADWWDSAPGKGDDRQPALTWVYAQKKGEKGRYDVEIRLERREA